MRLKSFKQFLNEHNSNSNNSYWGPGSLIPIVEKLFNEGKSETVVRSYLYSLGVDDGRINSAIDQVFYNQNTSESYSRLDECGCNKKMTFEEKASRFLDMINEYDDEEEYESYDDEEEEYEEYEEDEDDELIEGAMSEIHIIAKESKNEKEFLKKTKEFTKDLGIEYDSNIEKMMKSFWEDIKNESINLYEERNSIKLFNKKDIYETSCYKESMNMVKEISEDMEGNTFHHHYHIMYPLAELLGNNYKTFAEIGSFCGGSMCLMLNNKKGKNHIAIDPFIAVKNQEKIFDNNTSKYISEGQSIKKFVGKSDDPKIIKEANEAIKNAGGADILFIDGSHAKSMVEKDFKNYHESVNPGGFIVFDDYMDKTSSPGVKIAVDEMYKNNLFKGYNVIGTLKNKVNAFSNGGSEDDNNEFIIQKNLD